MSLIFPFIFSSRTKNSSK